MRINVCEEQLNIIVHFACQDSANIFSFPCWIWIYVASDTLDKHYIHHLSCSLASEKGTICLSDGAGSGRGCSSSKCGVTSLQFASLQMSQESFIVRSALPKTRQYCTDGEGSWGEGGRQ